MQTLLDSLLPLWGTCEHEGKSVISAVFPYLLPEEYYAGRNVSRYAVVRDYHDICGTRLERACALLHAAFPGEEFHWHCDSTSLPEVELAIKAGLGVRGKHNLLITKEYGSWVFLGGISASHHPLGAAAPAPQGGHLDKSDILSINSQNKLAASSGCPPWGAGAKRRGGVRRAADLSALTDLHCQRCNACIYACPAGALRTDGFNKAKCLSFITQKKGTLTPEETALLRRAGTVWGCDLCQEACPRNRNARIEPLPEFLIDPIARITKNTPLAGRAYAWRGERVIKRNILLSPPPLQSPQNPPP